MGTSQNHLHDVARGCIVCVLFRTRVLAEVKYQKLCDLTQNQYNSSVSKFVTAPSLTHICD